MMTCSKADGLAFLAFFYLLFLGDKRIKALWGPYTPSITLFSLFYNNSKFVAIDFNIYNGNKIIFVRFFDNIRNPIM